MKVEKFSTPVVNRDEDDLNCCEDCGESVEVLWAISPDRMSDYSYNPDPFFICTDCVKILREKIDRLRLLVI